MEAFPLAGGWHIYFFPIFIGVSVILGLIWTYEQAPARLAVLHLDTGVGVLLGTLLGSRIGFVVFQWQYFKSHPIEIFQFQSGGYTWAGAVLGWIAALAIASRLTSISFLKLGDALINLAGCLSIGVWLGCWFEGIAYGFVARGWWTLPAVDEWGIIASRVPVQLNGAILTLILLMLFDGLKMHPVWKQRLRHPGISTSLFVSGLSAIIFLLTFIRDDPAPVWMGQRVDFWMSAGLLFCGIFLTGVIALKQKKSVVRQNYSISGL